MLQVCSMCRSVTMSPGIPKPLHMSHVIVLDPPSSSTSTLVGDRLVPAAAVLGGSGGCAGLVPGVPTPRSQIATDVYQGPKKKEIRKNGRKKVWCGVPVNNTHHPRLFFSNARRLWAPSLARLARLVCSADDGSPDRPGHVVPIHMGGSGRGTMLDVA